MASIEEMPKVTFERAYAKAQSESSRVCKTLVAAGYGSERGSETRARAASTGDALACDYVRVNDALAKLQEERDARLRWHGTTHSIHRKKTWHLGRR